jgi:hypothetical protein
MVVFGTVVDLIISQLFPFTVPVPDFEQQRHATRLSSFSLSSTCTGHPVACPMWSAGWDDMIRKDSNGGSPNDQKHMQQYGTIEQQTAKRCEDLLVHQHSWIGLECD